MYLSSSVLRGTGGRIRPLASALALTLFTGLTASASASYNPVIELNKSLPAVMLANTLAASPVEGKAYYTIVFKDAPVATYDGSVPGIPAPGALLRNGQPTGKTDIHSPAAQAYVSHLQMQQQAFLDNLGATVGRPLEVMARMQHALNAVIVRLDSQEAVAVSKRADVMFIEREHELELSTDRGPSYIGATSIWDGTTASGASTRGEGIVVGIIDTGVNWQSPAFAGVGPNDAYVHQNPRGAGNYLGSCQAGQPDAGRCNDKLIGMYNFAAPGSSGADTQGHGSHTASTVAGNTWNATYASGPFTISGVAPHANVITYLACPSTCPSTATSQSANQALIDGVDVLNYSISGGTSPWTDATSTAFRNAVAAGMFVAASAGNTSTSVPDPQGQVNHMEPWVETVAASTQDRIIAVSLDLTSEASPPPDTQDIPMRTGGLPLPTENLIDVPLIKSPGFADGLTDGCSAYPAGTFVRTGAPGDRIFADGFDSDPPPPEESGAIAVLHLDSTASACGSGARRTNALAAGAIGVIFVDVAYLNLGANLTSWSMLMTDWNNLEAGYTPATATVSIDIAAETFPAQGDVIAGFSFRGPRLVGGQGMVKPDITAPGVDILAVGAANVVGANGVYLNNGTSMASPHMAGAAALMRALNPTWTATQIKSALNLSSNNFGAVNQDGTPVRLWDYGSGRVNLSAASKVGLIMDETSANFLAANPTSGGDISSLNLASMAKSNFVGDTEFTRTFRRARAGSQTYTLSVAGFPAGAVEFSPASFSVNSSGTRTITVTAHGIMLPAAQWSLGELVLTPAGGDEPTLHLPIALSPAGPAIAVDPTSLSGSSDTTVSNDLEISNIGNPTLEWSVQTTGTPQVTPLNTTTSGSGQLGGLYLGVSEGNYWSQNFDISGTTTLSALRANGFLIPSGNLTTANTPSVTFSIYADAAGLPAGAPEGFGAAPIWTYTNTIGTASTTGITGTAGAAQLVFSAPGVPPAVLPDGRYWLTVFPSMNGSGAGTAANPLWAWRVSSDPQVGNPPVIYAPFDDPSQFQSDPETVNMSAFVQGNVSCALPSWVGLTTTSGSLGFAASETIPVTFDATGLSAGTYTATLCIASNATNAAVVPVPLTFTVPNGGSQAPTLSKAFAPTSVDTNVASTLTITLNNASPTASTLSAALVDTFPAGLVVAATPAEATTCAGGTVTAVAGSGSVELSSGAQIPAAGSCTVTVDVTSASAGNYDNVIGASALQTDTGNNASAANASLTVTTPPLLAPTAAVAFSPASVTAGTASTLTITLANANAVPATLTGAMDDNLPAGVLVAPTPSAGTTCPSGVVTAVAGSSLVSLGSAAQIPANDSCTVSVNVRAVSPGTFDNEIAAGALQTDAGNNAAAAADTLTVTAGTFPAPYCPRTITNAIEPITLVQLGSIDNASSNVVGGTPVLQDFLAVNGTLKSGATYLMTVKGNSDGDFINVYRAYFDWNQDGVFAEDDSERHELGEIENSTGLDAKQTSALITVPASATVGLTRVRVVKNYDVAGSACATGSYGQAEDYSITVDPDAPLPPAIAAVGLGFAPETGDIAVPTTLTISLGQYNGAAAATLTAPLVNTLPAGLTVAASPNASTNCPAAVLTALSGDPSITVGAGTQIPAAGCNVIVDLQASTPGNYVNSIGVGALQTDIGNNLAAASAQYRALASAPVSTSTGFEPPFTVGGINGQQGWFGSTTAGAAISSAVPAAGTQHLRITSTNSSSAVVNAISPTQAVGVSNYSVLTAKLRISRTTNGATFDLNPQDPVAGVVSTLVRFDKTAARPIQVANFSTGFYEPTGAQWPINTYFDIAMIFDRAAGSVELCFNGTSIYNGTDAVASPYIGNVNARWTGQTSTTSGNTMDVDELFFGDSNTPPACAPPAPTVSKAFAPIGVETGVPSTLTISLGNTAGTPATLTAPLTDTFPAGMVVAASPNASTTCTSGVVTAVAGSGAVALGSGAQIQPGGCSVTVDVTSATNQDYTNTIATGGLQTSNGNNASAASAVLFVGNLVVNSGPLNIVVPANGDGVYFDFLAGTNGTTQTTGSAWNPYGATNLTFFWPNSGTLAPGGVAAAGNYSVLASGSVVGPASTFSTSGAATATINFRQAGGVDGYLGIRFTNTSVTPNIVTYGYVHLQTTGTTGHPATVVDYAYNRIGQPITIP